ARDAGIVVHVDACAAAGHVDVDFGGLGADLCSVTGHPWGAPKGAAALLVRRGLRVPPFVVGGAQGRGPRGRSAHVPPRVGLRPGGGWGAAAAELRGAGLARGAGGARLLSEAIAAAAAGVPGVVRYGPAVGRLPNLVCLGIEGVEAEPIVLGLDQRGVAVHS